MEHFHIVYFVIAALRRLKNISLREAMLGDNGNLPEMFR
jgi:hypothetical protein